MKKLLIVLCAATVLFGCNGEDENTTANGGSKAETHTAGATATADEWVPVDSATAMRTMMEVGTPGEQHAMLAKGDGKWNAQMMMWMSPEAPPMTSTSTVVNKMIYGGRYQQTSFKGDMMGMPFEGTSTTGYDKAKKVYFTTWMDNMSTAMMNMEGTWDEASKTINFKGKMLCPANGKECEMREVYRIVDDNTHMMEMYGPDMQTGKEYKNMEIKFTRNK
ncbi:DUF1579 domain-containing protein [Segetibacter sp. 3557_3]|uniref:DUF1579 domain-containing protein n=1 Tax=Segetibacter sp. 3557_3 TaxID=2547429 RepID=UPI001058A85D|nr:DUF1579 domain-containing protein [Segetibacter sp. 3557_3]TDH27013.1 DUF1579 domain-containing protein [Segetibacter sp. 3557_3]